MTITSTAPAIPTVPTIHLNGTGATTLYKEYRAAYKAIDKAIDALCDTTLNGRDFYPQGADAFYRSRSEAGDYLSIGGSLRSRLLYLDVGLLVLSSAYSRGELTEQSRDDNTD